MAKKEIPWAGNRNGVEDKYQAISGKILPVAGWPDEKKPKYGESRQTSAPSWMTVDYRLPGVGRDMDSTKGTPSNDRNVKDVVKESKETVKEQGEIRAKGTKNFLHCWAKKMFVHQSMQNCTASMTIPLDIQWGCQHTSSPPGTLDTGPNPMMPKSVGWVYKMSASNADGAPIFLFEGYLRSVTHELNVGERTGKAVTQLMFTHVKGPKWSGTKHEPKYGCAPWVTPEVK
jgi:hypothetical protein